MAAPSGRTTATTRAAPAIPPRPRSTGNVARLQVAWTFRTGALGHSAPLDRKAAFEATPILVEGKLFLKRLLVRLFRPALLESGSPNLGGPIATAGGLVFTAASMDNHLRAFDSDTGRELWKYELPAGGQATPMTYRVDGRQYLVIAAGGHGKLGTKLGDYVVAFTLP